MRLGGQDEADNGKVDMSGKRLKVLSCKLVEPV